MSASSSPTLKPRRASASARLTESVVLPTPPLPEPTAMMELTPGIACGPSGSEPPECACICKNVILTNSDVYKLRLYREGPERKVTEKLPCPEIEWLRRRDHGQESSRGCWQLSQGRHGGYRGGCSFGWRARARGRDEQD